MRELNKKKVVLVIAIAVLIILIIVGIVAICINSKTQEVSAEIDNSKQEQIASTENVWDIQVVDNESDEVQSDTEQEENENLIYLTFDDGPSTEITPKILDILKKENVKATFFVINYNSDKEELIKREVEEGHSIGLHGYSHNYKEIYKSEDTYMENLSSLQTKILKSTGVKSTITRFPGGSSNTVSKFNKKIMTKLTKRVEKEGYKYYDWNVDSDDAGSAKTKDEIYNNVTKALKKGRANVVLMHDSSKKTKTLEALESIIEYGKKNGYTFKAITTDSDLVMHHKVLN